MREIAEGGLAAIERSEIRRGVKPAPVLSLLFDLAARPNAPAIRGLESSSNGFSISHDSACDGEADGAAGDWLELLVNGLTFDLLGLAPGSAQISAPALHRFDLPKLLDPAKLAAIALIPGPHLAGGETLMPVVRSQMWLATRLCALPGVAAVGWEPARSLSSPAHFTRSVERWLEGGVFPGLGLSALKETPDGGMESVGLAFFTGQELRLEPGLAGDKPAAARLALRLINELVGRDRLERAERIKGPGGEALLIELVENGRILSVSRDRG
jgi:hypothetical protein